MSDAQKWLVLAFFLITSWLVYILSPVLMPFVFAAILAYLGDPIVDRLEVISIKKFQLGRSNAVAIVFLLMLLVLSAVLIILIPKVEFQISQFLGRFPTYIHWLNETIIPKVDQYLGLEISKIEVEKITAVIKTHWQKAGKSALVLMGSVSHSGMVIAEWAMNIILIPVITFYLLRDWDVLIEKVYQLLPRRAAPTAAKLALETNEVLGAFLRGQFYVMVALGTIYSLGLWLVGLELAILIGMLAGVVSFVPYLGSVVGITVACVAALVQFQDVMFLFPVSIVFIAGQLIEGMLLTPWLVGDKIGLHPVAVMFAVLAGGQLFGFLGILLALPVASVIMVILRHVHDIYRDSDFYRTEDDPC